MLDHGFLPRTSIGQVFQFTNLGSAASTSWEAWVKPRNISMIYMKLIGAGSGGGGGMTGAAGTARGGGGGGGSGAITELLIPASFLPDVLYIAVGRGAAGANATGIGSAGGRSFVSMQSDSTTATHLVATSGAASGGGGAAGTAATGGAGGAAGSIATTALAIGHNYGNPVYRAGVAGTAGGAQTGAAGVAVAWGVPGITGGTGGGGTPIANTDFAGGAITTAGLIPTLAGGLAAAGVGSAGYLLTGNPMWASLGGTGGGTAGAAGTAGKGGDAALGSGGGGGGGGVTGGAGGRGGDGSVIFWVW